MNKVLSAHLWKKVRALCRKARCRKAAVAYVTKNTLGLRKGDTLVVDASYHAIQSGNTSASLLWTLLRQGVHVFSYPGLHAKVISCGKIAVIGSANMSESSSTRLLEAAVVTDNASVIGGVESLLYHLQRQSARLSPEDAKRLKSIKVVKRPALSRPGWQIPKIPELGNRTWLLGVHELAADAFPKEHAITAVGEARAEKKRSTTSNKVDWIRFTRKDRAAAKLQPGETLIEIWRPLGRKTPTMVYRNAVVLARQKERTCTRFYIESRPGHERDAITWQRFKKLLKKMGFPGAAGPASERRLDPDWADLIQQNWKRLV
jgi:hypothetical protein